VIEELARHRCTDAAGLPLFVVEQRAVFTSHDANGQHHRYGAARMAMLNGEPVRYIDERTFSVVASGEIITHDPIRCGCTPAPRIVARDGAETPSPLHG
jgi:hypothetical protein